VQHCCALHLTSCVSCNRIACPLYRELCSTIDKIRPIFVRENHRVLREVENIFRDLLDGSRGVKALAFRTLQEALNLGKTLDKKTIEKLKRFIKNPANLEICGKFMVH
jgi:hypothetical protein